MGTSCRVFLIDVGSCSIRFLKGFQQMQQFLGPYVVSSFMNKHHAPGYDTPFSDSNLRPHLPFLEHVLAPTIECYHSTPMPVHLPVSSLESI